MTAVEDRISLRAPARLALGVRRVALGAALVVAALLALPATAAATWTVQIGDAKPLGANGRPAKAIPNAGPPGKIATVTGTLDGGDVFHATCDTVGSATFNYIQPGRWVPALADVDFTVTIKADKARPVTLTTRPRRISDNLVAYSNSSDSAAIEGVLQNFVNALRTIELDVEAKGFGVQWSKVASALDSTRTTQRFAQACGINLLPFGTWPATQ